MRYCTDIEEFSDWLRKDCGMRIYESGMNQIIRPVKELDTTYMYIFSNPSIDTITEKLFENGFFKKRIESYMICFDSAKRHVSFIEGCYGEESIKSAKGMPDLFRSGMLELSLMTDNIPKKSIYMPELKSAIFCYETRKIIRI